jgi:hypothetical protein
LDVGFLLDVGFFGFTKVWMLVFCWMLVFFGFAKDWMLVLLDTDF